MESRLTNHSSEWLTATADFSRSRIAARFGNNPLELTGLRPPAQRVVTPYAKEEMMPHVIVKLYPGRSEQQKTQLAEEIVKDVVAIAKCEEKSVSVAFEEIRPEDWAEKVYRPDILENQQRLYKKPGYNPFE